ncbi:hypothetical protein NW759_000506 [Fusarium solani]|nr:hypothetical protein NW759_000506 [Fusarium solani]
MARTKEDVVATSPRVAKSAAGVSKDTEAPVKRGRGRPRSAVPKPAYVPSGRPRGRPKGSTKASSAKKAALGEAVGLTKKNAASTDAPGAKRGRGRPRKVAQPEAEGESTTPKSGKKRGRPSKNATESPAAQDVAEDDNEESKPVEAVEPVEAAEPVEDANADDESDGDVPTAGQEESADKELPDDDLSN